ncbi:MAG: thermonuclease family protein [Phycisphaerae bacterium]|nr:thermonuclease family protein [Phycisphaerae bacterium]
MGLNDKYVRFLAVFTAILTVGLVAYRFFLWPYNGCEDNVEWQTGQDVPFSTQPERSDKTCYTVKRVIDGDTLVLDNGDTVRLIGVDTPETKHPEIPVQRFGKEASEFTRRMAEGREVTLEFDGPREGVYGRKLAYVFVGKTLLNVKIIRRGYGYAYTRFPHARMAEFIEAERQARYKQYGLWNYSLTDGRIANLAKRYEQLSKEGKMLLEKTWDQLLKKYPGPGEPETETEQ